MEEITGNTDAALLRVLLCNRAPVSQVQTINKMTEQVSPRAAVIGCGYWGKNLVRNFSDLGVLAAVCDENPERARQFGGQYNVSTHTFEELLRDTNIDAVAIATPAETHSAITKKALLAGKHVFVEKPIAMDVGTAEDLNRLSKKQARVLMVGHVLQYHPAFIRLKELVAQGELGRLRHIYTHRSNLGKVRREENILWSFVPHDASMILSLVGDEPNRISAVGGFFLHSQYADVAAIYLSFPGGENAHVFVSWLHPYKVQELVVVGDEGMAVFNDTREWDRKLLFYKHNHLWENRLPGPDKGEAEAVAVAPAEPLRQELEHFLDCIAGKTGCRTDGHEGIRVLKVLQASEQDIRVNHSYQVIHNANPVLNKTAIVDLRAQQQRLGERIPKAIQKILDHGQYIMGPEVWELEEKLSDFSGARHVITCASGTDALLMALMAHDTGPGDAIFVPSFTFVATAEVVALLGATPVFVDVDTDCFLLDTASLKAAVSESVRHGLTPRGIIPVDLFGQPADYMEINRFAEEHGLFVIGDGAQSFGAQLNDKKVGALTGITTTSFFPAKPLGCYGDGGAVFTDEDKVADKLKSLRVHGKGADNYDNVNIGINGRLDTIQAAILLEKLSVFPEEIILRNQVAERYAAMLENVVDIPVVREGRTSVWAQYTIKTNERDGISQELKQKGVPTAVYYPKPLHRQTAYNGYPSAPDLSVSERLSSMVLSLPMHPYLEAEAQTRIIDAVRQALRELPD